MIMSFIDKTHYQLGQGCNNVIIVRKITMIIITMIFLTIMIVNYDETSTWGDIAIHKCNDKRLIADISFRRKTPWNFVWRKCSKGRKCLKSNFRLKQTNSNVNEGLFLDEEDRVTRPIR